MYLLPMLLPDPTLDKLIRDKIKAFALGHYDPINKTFPEVIDLNHQLIEIILLQQKYITLLEQQK